MQASKRIVDETQRLYATLLPPPPSATGVPLNGAQLARPTFKLILELVRQLMFECRILRDVFTAQDLEPARLRDRRAKLAFVERLIEFAAANRQPVIGCVAARVLDGQEPNKTLELLQALGRVAQQRLSASAGPSGARLTRPRTFTSKPRQTPASASKSSTPPKQGSPIEVVEQQQPPKVAQIQVSTKPEVELEKVSASQEELSSGLIGQLRVALRNLHLNHLTQCADTQQLLLAQCQREAF